MSREHIAPEGSVWMCGACGRNGTDRYTIGDESCFLNSVLVKYPILYTADGSVQGFEEQPQAIQDGGEKA